MKKTIISTIFLIVCAVMLTAQVRVRGAGYGNTSGALHVGYGNGYPNIYLGSYIAPAHPGKNNGEWGIEVWNTGFNVWKPWPSIRRTIPVNGDYGNFYIYINRENAVGIGKIPTRNEICLDVNGSIYCNDVLITSDERLKTNIRPLSDKTALLYRLNGKSYDKKAQDRHLNLPKKNDSEEEQQEQENRILNSTKLTKEFGFLAQELEKVYPELVRVDSLGSYSVNYIGLIPVLVEAIKEQKEELDNLKQQLKNIKSLSEPAKAKATPAESLSPDTNNTITLYQNNPNPFSQSTEIRYYLPKEVGHALLCIYEMNGKQLKQFVLPERDGEGTQTIQATELTAGIYLYALLVDGKEVDVKRMILTE